MMDESAPLDVTQLLRDWSRGEQTALDRLTPLVYDDLRRVAGRCLRDERRDHTLQATALVNETYLRLVDQRRVRWEDRAHFFAVAAQVMRRILVDYARRHVAAKRGGGAVKLTLDGVAAITPDPGIDVVALHEALERLAAMDPRQGRIVELRFFGGLTIEETAEVLTVSPATVKNDWSFARAWLYRELETDSRV